jgi:transglutaminase-like putative cysteine protease
MHRIVSEHSSDTKKLAQKLKAANLRDTLRNIWNFVYTYIQYEPDSKLFEQLRRPLRTLHDQKGDCDCYAILIGSVLTNLNIPYSFRVAEYENRGFFQHVYVVVPNGGGYITVDPVVEKFDYEKPFTKKKDFTK